MLDIKIIDSITQLRELKAQYFANATAALDGMWHFGFVPMAKHFGFYQDNELVGYCCINTEAYLLQFYLGVQAKVTPEQLFSQITQQTNAVVGDVKGAFVSTAEPRYLSLCLDNNSRFEVNSRMYEANPIDDETSRSLLDMKLAQPEQLSEFVRFAYTNIGAQEQWLSAYFGQLIERKELWGYWNNNTLIASGECRLFDDFQSDYAELGMIVADSERGKGIATRVLLTLRAKANNQGYKVICSTEQSNVSAQIAIERAGMISTNRIIQVNFDRN